MFLFKRKPKSCLGIDLGASAIKMVELERKDERYILKNYAIYSLEKYFQKKIKEESYNFNSPPNKEMAGMIKKAINYAKINSRDTYLSVPVYSSFSTVIDFPLMSNKEIESSISFEAGRYIPIPISEVFLDWSIVGSTDTNSVKKENKKKIDSSSEKELESDPRQEILLIAVPKEIIKNYNEITDLLGLKLRAIEEETFSLSRSLIGNDKLSTLLIDAGFRSINVSIIDNGYIKVTHNLEMGGIKIDEAICKNMDLDSEKAEKIKLEFSKNELSREKSLRLEEIINPIFKDMVDEIRKIIDNYQLKYKKKIERCILTGGCFGLLRLVDYFKNELPLNISVGDPFARVIYDPGLKEAIKELGPSLAVATGLAMREE